MALSGHQIVYCKCPLMAASSTGRPTLIVTRNDRGHLLKAKNGAQGSLLPENPGALALSQPGILKAIRRAFRTRYASVASTG